MCHLQNNNINQKHSNWISVGNFLAYLSANASQIHFRNLSDPGDPVKNEPKVFQIVYTTLVELFQEQ